MEGRIVWKKNQYMLQFFENGEEILHPLEVGDSLEVFINDAWVKAEVGYKQNELALVGINYGDGIGCMGRIAK